MRRRERGEAEDDRKYPRGERKCGRERKGANETRAREARGREGERENVLSTLQFFLN